VLDLLEVLLALMPLGVEHAFMASLVGAALPLVLLALMPLGVEHGRCAATSARAGPVLLALMPLGVEHSTDVVQWREYVRCPSRLDAVRR